MEGDSHIYGVRFFIFHFNPLPPHGGRPTGTPGQDIVTGHFNPLPPHGGRRSQFLQLQFSTHISIHSLRMEGDIIRQFVKTKQKYFNPLPPHGGRHQSLHRRKNSHCISIHSLRMEGDISAAQYPPYVGDFNPLPPHGGRLSRLNRRLSLFSFQSTPSAWRETFPASSLSVCIKFQSTPSAWRETVDFIDTVHHS